MKSEILDPSLTSSKVIQMLLLGFQSSFSTKSLVMVFWFLSTEQWFSTQVILVLGEFNTVRRHFCLHNSGATTGVMWMGPRDAPKHPTTGVPDPQAMDRYWSMSC